MRCRSSTASATRRCAKSSRPSARSQSSARRPIRPVRPTRYGLSCRQGVRDLSGQSLARRGPHSRPADLRAPRGRAGPDRHGRRLSQFGRRRRGGRRRAQPRPPAAVIWMQLGVVNEEAAERARERRDRRHEPLPEDRIPQAFRSAARGLGRGAREFAPVTIGAALLILVKHSASTGVRESRSVERQPSDDDGNAWR